MLDKNTRSCTHGTKLKEIKIRKFKRNTVFLVFLPSLGDGRVSRVEGHRSRVEGHKSRVEGHRSRFESRGRGSKVEVEGQKSRVENTKFLSILKILQPLLH